MLGLGLLSGESSFRNPAPPGRLTNSYIPNIRPQIDLKRFMSIFKTLWNWPSVFCFARKLEPAVTSSSNSGLNLCDVIFIKALFFMSSHLQRIFVFTNHPENRGARAAG